MCGSRASSCLLFFFFNDTATTEIYTLSLHDALPIWPCTSDESLLLAADPHHHGGIGLRSEEHTSELQSLRHLVCRLLLEKKYHSECANRKSVSSARRLALTSRTGHGQRHAGRAQHGHPDNPGRDVIEPPAGVFFKCRGAPRIHPPSPTPRLPN